MKIYLIKFKRLVCKKEINFTRDIKYYTKNLWLYFPINQRISETYNEKKFFKTFH